jgi:hypothetical protein
MPTWGLSYTKWHRVKFSSVYFGFPLSVSLHQCFIRIFIYHPHYIIFSNWQRRKTMYLTNLSLSMQYTEAKKLHKDCHPIKRLKFTRVILQKWERQPRSRKSTATLAHRVTQPCYLHILAARWRQCDIIFENFWWLLQHATACLWGCCVIVDTVPHLRHFSYVSELTFVGDQAQLLLLSYAPRK